MGASAAYQHETHTCQDSRQARVAAATAADMECIVDEEQLRLYVFSLSLPFSRSLSFSALCLVSKIKK